MCVTMSKIDDIAYRTVFKVEYASGSIDYIVAKDFKEVMKIVIAIKNIPDSIKNIFDEHVLAITRGEVVILKLNKELFPEVKWEDEEPREVIIKLKEE